MNLTAIAHAWGRALLAQFHWRILFLSLLPFFLSLALWGLALWWGMQDLVDFIQAFFVKHEGFKTSGAILEWTGMLAFKTVIVPFIAMWLLLPFMVLTSLLATALMAMPVISRHVSRATYPDLEQRQGGSLIGSVWHSASSFFIFLLLWLVTLPLLLLPPLHFVVQGLLLGWLTYRVMAYDALAEHADAAERLSLTRQHRTPFLIMGTISGIIGGAPMLLWVGGVMSFVFFPFLAGLAIWLYVLVFIFTGLWFQYYCMAALQQHRSEVNPAN
ncbi:EI24 domain-containing protein [Undibacterium sp.]|uniref:EI24 domain-containing protein n=1 Tax=Undibacterium sp. TaxID=1914977 RepID=UPI0025FA8142|nr:EI24 domain-containing protein [Undibacterium sp.]